MEKSKKYNFIKVVMMVLVVVAHTTRMYTPYGVVKPIYSSKILVSITNFIYGFHMPLFIFISGAVYCLCVKELEKYKDTFKFIVKKFKRLMIPYFVFGIFYVTPIMIIFHFTNNNIIEYIIKGILLCLNSRHLWFLYYLFIYFLIYKLIVKEKPNAVFIGSLIAISLLKIPLLSDLSLYAIYFTMGFIFNDYYDIYFKSLKVNIMIICALLVIYVLSIYLNWTILVVNSVGIVTFGTLLSLFKINEKNKFYKLLLDNSMGIYLFHPMIIYILFYYWGQYNVSPIILSLVIFIISFGISLILTILLRKTKLKFILGE